MSQNEIRITYSTHQQQYQSSRTERWLSETTVLRDARGDSLSIIT